MNLLSVFAGGLWIPLVLGIIGVILFAYFGYRSWASGSHRQLPGGGYSTDDGRLPFYKVPQWVMGFILLVFVIIYVIAVSGDK